jgi:hypothetical protein
MTKRRGPFTDPRDGRLLRQIRNAYSAFNTDVSDASTLLEWAYCHRLIRTKFMRSRTGKPVKWPHEMLKRALLKVATPVG